MRCVAAMASLSSLRGKHVFITGGSSGIGLACAKQFAKEGAVLTLVARNFQGLEKARQDILHDRNASLSSGGKIFPDDFSTLAGGDSVRGDVEIKSVDVTDRKAVFEAIRESASRQPIDVLVCNAGLVRPGYIEELCEKDVTDQINVNILGTVHPIQAVLPEMKKRSRDGHPSSIVIVSSLSALSFWYGAAVYTATKYSVRGLAETLRVETLPYNIHVSVICPGFTETPFLDDAESSGSKLTKMMKVASMYKREDAESAEHIAGLTVSAVKERRFLTVTTRSPVASILTALSRGLHPPHSWPVLILESIVLGPLRLLSALINFGFQRDVIDAYKKLD